MFGESESMDQGQVLAENYEPVIESEPIFFESASHTIARNEKDPCEDSVVCDPESGFFVVADGVGGEESGDVVSAFMTSTTKEQIKKARSQSKPLINREEREKMLREAVEKSLILLNREVSRDLSLQESGTTFSAFLLDAHEDGKIEASYLHVGDSRLYVYRSATQTLERIGRDDSFLQSFVDFGILSEETAKAIDQTEHKGRDVKDPVLASFDEFERAVLNKISVLSRSEEKILRQYLERIKQKYDALLKANSHVDSVAEVFFCQRNLVTNTIKPNESPEPQIGTVAVFEGDILLGITDGIGDVLTEERLKDKIVEGLRQGKTIEEIVQDIAKEAKTDTSERRKRGGDDIGIFGVRIKTKK